jgi:dolichol-phosphate mannosyltransferase
MENLGLKLAGQSLSVVISFKNEAETIPHLWRRLKESLESQGLHNFQIILVNDASTDNSRLVCETLASKDHRILLINTTRSFGNAECVIAGFQYAKGDLIAYLDADLQDPPELLPKLLQHQLLTGADVVHTKRIERHGESKFKKIITKFGYMYLQKFMQPPIPAEMGDFKLLTKRVVRHILSHQEPYPFLRGIIENLSFPSSYVEYERQPRFNGQENTKFQVFGKKWFRSHTNSTLISFSDAPLKLALKLGLTFASLAFISIPIALYLKYAGLAVPGWSGLVILISFFSGVNLLFMGVLGLYLNSIFIATRKRPMYVIESVMSNGELRLIE